MKKTNVLKTLVAVATIFVGFTFSQCGISEKDVQKIAKEANDYMGCPVKVDFMTMLDSIHALPGKEIHYHYTLLGYSAEDMDDLISKNEFEKNIRTVLLTLVNANTKESEDIRRSKIILVADYYDEYGEHYSSVRIGPKEYDINNHNY
ncbi:MAG: hypothetical protein LBG19_02705 [Prevotellaceae bacterium]|jgi:hypothetical protein|nr:hypothetical protein [Prevotellaceae bacterium]